MSGTTTSAEFIPKRSTRKRKYTKKQKEDYELLRRLARPLGVETKYYDIYYRTTTPRLFDDDPANITSNMSPAAMDCLNAVTIGDEANQRDGRSITMKSIQIRGFVQSAAASTVPPLVPQPVTVRLALVVDHQNHNLNSLTWSHVFNMETARDGDTGLNALTPDRYGPMTFRSLERSKRFTVLWDETINFNYADTYATNTTPATGVVTVVRGSSNKYWFHVLRDLNNMVVNYTGDDGVSTDIVDNCIYLLGISTPIATGTGSLPQLDYHTRLRFRG